MRVAGIPGRWHLRNTTKSAMCWVGKREISLYKVSGVTKVPGRGDPFFLMGRDPPKIARLYSDDEVRYIMPVRGDQAHSNAKSVMVFLIPLILRTSGRVFVTTSSKLLASIVAIRS